jgi:uncharacterized small protein (DUF1192 family)
MTTAQGWVKGAIRDYAGADLKGTRGMMDEDDAPVRKHARLEKLVLDTLGIDELREYIDELRVEIARVEADIERKQGHRNAADSFFRRP